MTHPKVSIIIVNFNQKQLTLNCLKSLGKVTYSNYEIIVVDNDSQDGSVEAISKMYPKVRQVLNKSNSGYVGGNNAGIKQALGKYLLILNNDTIVTPDFIEPLVIDLEKDTSLGIVQSKIFIMDNPKQLDNVVSYLTNIGFLFHIGYLDIDKPEYKKFRETFAAKGACMMVRKSVFELGAFDEKYWCYFEESDLCWRAWVMGYHVAFEPKSIIYHKMGATSTTMKSAFIHYHSFKNRIRTIIKNASIMTLFWMLPAHVIVCIALSAYFFLSGQTEGAVAILKAIWWNLLNVNDTLERRSLIQKKRKLDDSEIFRLVLKNPSQSFYLHHLSLVRANLKKG
mgnify:CR=1 FL=1